MTKEQFEERLKELSNLKKRLVEGEGSKISSRAIDDVRS